MTHWEMKKKITHSIKLLIVGAILIVCSILYLDRHPWEKASIMPSFQNLSFQWKLLLYKTLGKDTSSLEAKQEFTKIYSELNYLLESSNCTDPDIIDDILKQQQHLSSITQYSESEQYNALTQAQNLKERIEQECSSI